jgi:hypothetical protein
MPDYQRLIHLISAETGTVFRAASETDLAALRVLRLPDTVLNFFARHEPSDCAEGQVCLWPIADILQENRNYVPGAYVDPLGYVVFSTTFCGDTYCFDVNVVNKDNEPRIVLISHEVVEEDITAEEAQRLAKPVAKYPYEFLDTFLRQELDEECIYRVGVVRRTSGRS